MRINKIWLMATALLLLSSCGFSPIYGPKDAGDPVVVSLGNVSLANIEGRQGQMLRNHLIDRMYHDGRPAAPTSRLEVKLHSAETDLGVLKDATASRQQYNLWADYVLRSLDGQDLAKGTAHSVVSYSKMDAQYGTLMTKKNAQERATAEVGEQIVNRISLYFAEKASEKEGPEAPENNPAEP